MRQRRRRRFLQQEYTNRIFKPAGIPAKYLETTALSHEELEVLRLRYIEGMNQTEAAETMGISQSQYQRDVWNANKKITEAIINGNAIEIGD